MCAPKIAQINQTRMMNMPIRAEGLLKNRRIFSLRAFFFPIDSSDCVPGTGGGSGISSSMTPITGLPAAHAG